MGKGEVIMSEIELGTLKAIVQDEPVLMLKVEIASGSFSFKEKEYKYHICQSAGGRSFIVSIEGKKDVFIELEVMMKMIVDNFDKIPDKVKT